MKKSPLQNLYNEAQHVRLSESEKRAMRAHIFSTPVRPILVRSSFSWFSVRFAVPVAAVLVVVMGSGTALAAQGALPGDMLYTIKTEVNEPVQGALAFSEEAKASFHTHIVQVRLEEAESLASEGRLDTTVAAKLESEVESHVAQADTIAKNLENEDAGVAVEVSARLDSSLSAHGSILARIGEGSYDEQTKENSSSLATRIRTHDFGSREGGEVAATLAIATSPMVEMSTMSLATSDSQAADASSTLAPQPYAKTARTSRADVAASEEQTVSQKKIALQLQKKAQSEFKDTQSAYHTARRSLTGTTTEKIQAQLASLKNRIEEGSDELRQEQYEDARTTFVAVLKDSVELRAFIEASKKFNKDFVLKISLGAGANVSKNKQNEGNDKKDEAGFSSTGAPALSAGSVLEIHANNKGGGEQKSQDEYKDTNATSSGESGGLHIEVHL